MRTESRLNEMDKVQGRLWARRCPEEFHGREQWLIGRLVDGVGGDADRRGRRCTPRCARASAGSDSAGEEDAEICDGHVI